MRLRPDIVPFVREGSLDAAGVLFDRYWPYAWKAAYPLTVFEESARAAVVAPSAKPSAWGRRSRGPRAQTASRSWGG